MKAREKYRFKAYDPAITVRYEKEKKKILTIIPYATVEHVGSTAVPGLGGKGLLDILIVVQKRYVTAAKTILSTYYTHRPQASTPTRLFFRKDFVHAGKKNRMHLHLTADRNEALRMVLFRNHLRKHPATMSEYAMVKRRAAKNAQGEGKIYRDQKRMFIERVIRTSLK